MTAIVTLLAGLAIGFVAQRSRFCTVAPIRNWLLTGDWGQLKGLGAFLAVVYVLYSFAHYLGWLGWSAPRPDMRLLPMVGIIVLSAGGLGFVSLLMGSCPARQHVIAAEGKRDSMLYLLGFYLGIIVFHFATSRVFSWIS